MVTMLWTIIAVWNVTDLKKNPLNTAIVFSFVQLLVF
jgi:hypothetical protein